MYVQFSSIYCTVKAHVLSWADLPSKDFYQKSVTYIIAEASF
jgi:hypothetical protein